MSFLSSSRRYNWISLFGSFSYRDSSLDWNPGAHGRLHWQYCVNHSFCCLQSGECGRLQWQHCTSPPGLPSIRHESLDVHFLANFNGIATFYLYIVWILVFYGNFSSATYPLTESQERTVTFTGSTVQTVFPFL